MKRIAIITAFALTAVGGAWAAIDPDFITNCCECCKDILGCCCD
jgi:hypothetical protein